MEPADMSDKHSNPNAELPGGVYGKHHPAANEHMPRSIWQPGVVQRLADYIKHLRQVDHESVQPDISSEQHTCARNPQRTCNCPAGTCADDDATYRHARGPYLHAEYVQHAADLYTCPISGRICLQHDCRDWCESGVDRSKT